MTRLFDEHDVCLDAVEGKLAVSGDVDFEAAAPLAAAGAKWIADQPVSGALELDLRGVDRVSSAALSVMLEWLRSAQRAGIEVSEVRLSPALAKLTALAGLDALLPQAGAHKTAVAD
jgi:phospholipid transport system transporter-binding protein